LVSLALGDVVTVAGKGLQVSIRHSKTDPHGAGQLVAIWANPAEPSCCPLAAWQAWMGFRRDAADVCGGASDAELPLFVGLSKAGRPSGAQLSDKAVWRLVRVGGPGRGARGLGTLLWPFPTGWAGDGRRRGGG